MAFPCSLPVGQSEAPHSMAVGSQSEGPKMSKEIMRPYYDLAIKVMQHHYHQTLLVKALVQVRPCSWEGTLKSRL